MNQKEMDRRRYIPWIFLPTIIAVAIQSGAAIMALEFYIVSALSTFHGDEDYTGFVIKVMGDYAKGDGVAWTSIIYAVITTCIAFMIFRNKFREGKPSSLAGKSNNWALTVAGVILFTIGMQYVTVYLLNAFSAAFPSWLEEYKQLMDSAGLGTSMTVAMTAYAIILGPICEELLFRGITFFAAKKVMPVYFAILVQAIMFGAFHMNKLQGTYAFVLGLGLGYIMYLYDSLILTIIIHALFNLIGTLGGDYLPMGGDSLISFFLCCLGALVVSYLSIICLKRGSALVNNDTNITDI